MRLQIKVAPGASSDGIVRWMGDVLNVRVTAPPERGKANLAVVELLGRALRIGKESIRIVGGGTSPRKIIEIVGLTESEVRERLHSRHRRN